MPGLEPSLARRPLYLLERRCLRTMVLAVIVATVLAGCASSSTPSPSGTGSTEPRSRQQRKTLTIVPSLSVVDGFGLFSKPDVEQVDLVHAGLVRMNLTTGREEPWVAEQLPSLETGSWKVAPDGTMETSYRLREGIRWHDATPLASQDFAFGLAVARDPKVPSSLPGQGDKMERIETPDDRTLVIHWKTPYRLADRLIRTDLFALPKHLLESVYLSGDVDRFVNASFWLQDFVGTGPFKVANIQLGSSIELVAFDDYFLGRPRVDAITLQQVDNINTMLTYVLSGTIDVALSNSFTIDAGLTAKSQWEDRGQGHVIFAPASWTWVNLSALNPWLTDVRVRRALLHAINREEIVQTIYHGYVQVIEAPMSPARPQFPRADALMMKTEYNPGRALQLLEDAGWRRGPEGVLVNGQGEKFSIEGRRRSDDYGPDQLATLGFWNPIGVEIVLNNQPSEVEATPEFRNHWPGAYWQGHNLVVEEWATRFGNDAIPTEANRWAGLNSSRWSTPEKETVLREMGATLDQQRWEDLSVEFARLFSVQLPHLPLHTNTIAMAVKKGISGVQPRAETGERSSRTWNVERWEME